MKNYIILLSFFLAYSCTRKESSTDLSPNSDSVEGTYSGYRSQQNGQRKATDSIRITLTVKRLGAERVEILQTSPNEFKYTATMEGHRFAYDLGLTEAACGAAQIRGEGTFTGKELYLLETQECTRTLTAAKTFTQLRATRQ